MPKIHGRPAVGKTCEIDAKLVLRTYKEKPEEQEKVIKAKFKK